MSTSVPTMPSGGPGGPIAFTRDNTAMRLGVAIAASIGLNVLLVMGAGRLAQSMELRAPSRDEQTAISVTTRTLAQPTASPTAKPVAVATPVAARPTPRAQPTPRVAQATPRPIATPRALATPRPIRSTQRERATTQVASATTRTSNSNPDRPVSRLGNTTAPSPAPPAARAASSSRIQASAADTAAGSRTAGSAGPAVRPTQPVASGRFNDNPAALGGNVSAPEAISTDRRNIRNITTSGGTIAKSAARNNVVMMNPRAAAASGPSTNSFELPSGGTVRAGTATARQGVGSAAEVTNFSGTPNIISSNNEEAQVLSAPGANRRLIGVNSAAIRGPIGTTVTDLRARTGTGAGIQAGIGEAGGAAGGTGAGAAGGGPRGVATRLGGAASGVGGELSAVGGGGAGATSEGVGVGNGSGRGTAAVGNGNGGGGGGRIRGTSGPAGGPGGGTRAGSGGGISGVPDGVPGGTVATSGTKIRGTGGTATGKAGNGPGRIDSDNTAKVEDTVNKADKAPPKPVTVSENASDVSVGNNATQVGARATSKPGIDNFLTDEMRRTRISSTLRFKVTVEANGRASIDLLDGSGNSDVDRAVTSYLKAWRWEPAKQDGKAVQSTLTQSISLSQK